MKHIWDAIIARIVYWIIPKPKEVLKPGICTCTHARHAHVNGKGRCVAEFPSKGSRPKCYCACQIFILDDDDDDGGGLPDTPSPELLESWFAK
jgi:hypothetical protein